VTKRMWLRGGMVGVVALVVGCFGAPAARAQLVGHISLAKEVYMAGEPVYVQFELTNVGKEPVQYTSGDPYSDGCGSYTIEVQSGPPVAHSSCERGSASECIVGTQIIGAGETRHENILVNYAHDVSKVGNYEIHAVRALKYGPFTGGTESPAGSQEFKVEAHFQIRVTKGDRETLEAIYRPYVVNLGSRDAEIQTDAERVIVGGAPAWLEDTIVGMLRRSTSREFALLGLRNLNTARSREELAKIVQNTSEYTQQNEAAIGYLAQMGDKKYFPLLRDIAQKDEPNQARDHVMAAAELGGEDALPFLQGLLNSADPFARANGLMGLEKTGSRAAVALLIEALKDPNVDFGRLALTGLTGLTHRSAFADEKPAEEYGRWAKWWTANGSSAAVYGPRECGEIEPLP
jgi:hypothetical protein